MSPTINDPHIIRQLFLDAHFHATDNQTN